MKYLDFQRSVLLNPFTLLDVKKYFPKEDDSLLKVQLGRFTKRGLVTKIKRGLYAFSDPSSIDEFELANRLYTPSYVSLESALNYYGLIPDIVQGVTSISPTTTKKIKNRWGTFSYIKIKRELYWGYETIQKTKGEGHIYIAQKEKALLDFLYIRKIARTGELRLTLADLNVKRYKKYTLFFPPWVQKIKLNV